MSAKDHWEAVYARRAPDQVSWFLWSSRPRRPASIRSRTWPRSRRAPKNRRAPSCYPRISWLSALRPLTPDPPRHPGPTL